MIANLHVATKYLEGLAIYNFDLDLKLFLLFSFCSFLEYVCMITGVYKHMCVHMHVYEHMWRPEANIGYLPPWLFHFIH